MIQYIPVEQFLYSPDNGRYCSYGIAAVSLTALHCEIVLFVSDISGDRSFVADLASAVRTDNLTQFTCRMS